MAQALVDRRDQDFVIWEQLRGEKTLDFGPYGEFNRKTCDMIITEARQLSIKELLPTLAVGDEQGVSFKDNQVSLPQCFQRAHALLLQGEWNNLSVPGEMGGQGLPPLAASACEEYLLGAGWALYSYGSMGQGIAHMIYNYGSKEQIKTYVRNCVSGKWCGTMLLTESDAGSDVGSLSTTAVENEDGTYSITGNKIFITNGEHDLSENIIHPVLARIEGAPEGSRGISIFIVPKFLVNEDGSPGQRNHIYCTGVEHKHGIKASATCTMTMGAAGECKGFLLGEPQQGMKVMFNMMNGARMSTGLQALAFASSSYLLAANYAKQRIQGRDLRDFGKPDAKSVAIINHPDVRRNLTWMKANVEGMRSFFYYTVMCKTRGENSKSPGEREKYQGIFELVTPLIKEYLAVVSHGVCCQAMQTYGGAGYTKDYLVEQYTRDCKITSIYEGTSGIQAMDLLGRKLGQNNGTNFINFLGEIQKTISLAKKISGLEDLGSRLEIVANRLGEVAAGLGQKAMSPETRTAFAHSLPFLHAMGDTIMGWMLLWRASTAKEKLSNRPKKKDVIFYEGQVKTAEFYIKTILPGTLGKMSAIEIACSAAIEIDEKAYGGM